MIARLRRWRNKAYARRDQFRIYFRRWKNRKFYRIALWFLKHSNTPLPDSTPQERYIPRATTARYRQETELFTRYRGRR